MYQCLRFAVWGNLKRNFLSISEAEDCKLLPSTLNLTGVFCDHFISHMLFRPKWIHEKDTFNSYPFYMHVSRNKTKRFHQNMAMYKTRNTGTGKGMRGTQGMRVMLYSGEYRQTFQGMSPNIPGNVAKHSDECPQTFRKMSPNIPGNVAKNSGECR